MKALEIKNLHKSFGKFEALKGIDIEIEKGKCLGLLGTNGAGKSTTIKIITGQLSATSGEVRVFNLSPSTHLKEIHRMIGLVPEGQPLYDDITVKENLDVFRRVYNLPQEKTLEIADELELSQKLNSKIKDLSKGLRQRVLIAKAIIHSPTFLLLDEPTSGLDPSSSENIYKRLEILKAKGTTILLTTHLMNDVERLCDDIVFINKGKIVAKGTPSQIKSDYKENQIIIEARHLTTNNPTQRTFSTQDDYLSEIYKLKEQYEILSIKTHEPKLEEIFISLTETSNEKDHD